MLQNVNLCWNFSLKYVIINSYGDVMVSTGVLEHRWQVECLRHRHKKINANKIKNVLANLGATPELTYA